MTKDEATTNAALKLALDLAIMHHSDDGYAELRSKVRQLAKEALALTSTPCEVQPEQEPVAFSCLRCVTPKKCAVHGCSPNTWPSEFSPKRPWGKPWVSLTDEEIAGCAERMEASDPTDSFWREFAQATEAKLKEKNT